MTFDEIVRFLEDHENPIGKKVLMRHGRRDPFYGVRIGDLKKWGKSVPTDTASVHPDTTRLASFRSICFFSKNICFVWYCVLYCSI
jgi:hypothetical protein